MSVATCIARLKDDTRGVALVEFACVLPVLLLMYLAGYQLADALSCNRKVTITTRAVADLTTQNSTITPTQLSTILNASTQIMAPYNASNALVRVSELSTDTNGNTTVVWSNDNRGSGGRAVNSSYTLPASIQVNGSFIILSEVTYAYTPAVSFGIVGPLSLADKIYMNPRVSNSVDMSS